MKLQKLVHFLTEHGAFFCRHGNGHDFYRSRDGRRGAAVPRHKEIKAGTARAVCFELGLPCPL